MAVCCIFIACKIEEIKPPSIHQLAMSVQATNSVEQLTKTEVDVL